MRSRTLCAFLALIFLFLGAKKNSQAAPDKLLMLLPVTGQITADKATETWQFDALKDQHISLRMQATSGNLDPLLELLDTNNKSLLISPVNSYHTAIIDDFVIPADGVYTVRAAHTPTRETSGTYSLSLLPGYGYLLLKDPPDTNSPLRQWQTTTGSALIVENKLRLTLRANNQFTWTTAVKLLPIGDGYIQVDAQVGQANDYWEQGIVLRDAKRDNLEQFYTFLINSKAQWKFALSQPGGLTAIQDWTDLPFPVQSSAMLGVLAKGDTFTFFYNGKFISTVQDKTLTEPGLVGLVTGTGDPGTNLVSVVTNVYSNLVITLPTNVSTTAPVTVPAKLTKWARPSGDIIGELLDAKLVPGNGKEILNMDQGYVANNSAASIVFIRLARGLTVSDLVYNADIQWESNSGDTACALEFRVADANNFTIVYIDRKGGYGVRQVTDNNGVIVSDYNLNDAIIKTNDATNRLTIVAIANGLYTYVNGTLILNTSLKQLSGSVYIAAYNYGKASSYCKFTNIWVRSFD